MPLSGMGETGAMRVTRSFDRNGRVVTRAIAGETLLVPVRDNAADLHHIFVLNPLAAHVWARLEGGARLDELVGSVCEAFEVDHEVAERDVRAFIDELQQADLVREA
jgi:hypothetical protein